MQKAKITVSGVSRNSDGVSRLETVNTGTFTEKNGYCYARYEETEASGMSGTTTTVKWNSSQVSLIRHGTYEMHQEFAEGGACAGDYRTPYLMIPLETKTKKVWKPRRRKYASKSCPTAGRSSWNMTSPTPRRT